RGLGEKPWWWFFCFHPRRGGGLGPPQCRRCAFGERGKFRPSLRCRCTVPTYSARRATVRFEPQSPPIAEQSPLNASGIQGRRRDSTTASLKGQGSTTLRIPAEWG